MKDEQNDAITVPMVKLRKDAILPSYAHENDAGMDIYSAEEIVIEPGKTVLVHTGIAMAIPDGFEAQIRPRSGISYKTMLRIPNSPGTIDAGYRDELCVIMHNASTHTDESEILTLSEKGNRHGNYRIGKGEKIAQIVFARVSKAGIREVESLDGIGTDRNGGFGSTGI
jgi:dUTP pyrophosphatase